MANQRNPWDILSGESSKAFNAFVIFRGLGPLRSIQAAAQNFFDSKYRPGKERQWEIWSSRHDWIRRAREWDQHVDEERQRGEIQACLQMKANHINEAQGLQSVAVESLKRLQDTMKKDPGFQISPGLVLQFITQGATLERLSRGEPTEIGQQTHKAVGSWSEFLLGLREQKGLAARNDPFGGDQN